MLSTNELYKFQNKIETGHLLTQVPYINPSLSTLQTLYLCQNSNSFQSRVLKNIQVRILSYLFLPTNS